MKRRKLKHAGGRPPLDKDAPLDARIVLRVNAAELAEFREIPWVKRFGVSEYLRIKIRGELSDNRERLENLGKGF